VSSTIFKARMAYDSTRRVGECSREPASAFRNTIFSI